MSKKQFPKGNITTKVIRGKARMYLQWSEDGVQKNKYIKANEQEEVLSLVAERDNLEKEYTKGRNKGDISNCFCTNVTFGNDLLPGIAKIENFKKRDSFLVLESYLNNNHNGMVCLLFGLRRTGKTTMILQAIKDLPLNQTAYIKMIANNTIDDLNKDLKLLHSRGFKYVFIDEVTLMKDFIDNASLFSDIYSMFGMKIILSGTDSLGFAISNDEELYDRSIMIHTTFIAFREYSNLLNINDIDQYLKYGGTFKMGANDFENNEVIGDCTFLDEESTRRYIDSAIAKNIQHSLRCYQAGNHFCHLRDLYESNELTNAINRIVEDMNHRFVISVITEDFVSHDLGSIKQIERKKALIENRDNILEEINRDQVTKYLMKLLDIKNIGDQTVKITDDHINEIKEYLKMLDLIVDIPAFTINSKTPLENIVICQPGLRYCQAKALICSLEQTDLFKQYPIQKRQEILQTLLNEVAERLLEEMVLLETTKTLPKSKKAFKLYFKTGEFEMVIFDKINICCELYEIKHSDKIDKNQYKHLINPEKCEQTEFEYGPITKKCVLYRGVNTSIDGIEYLNIESYLLNLGGQSK